MRRGFDMLDDATSLREMIDHTPLAVASLGFDRVLLSRVEDSMWIPERMHVAGDSGWASDILEAGRSAFRQLDASLLETQVVRHRTALCVTEPETRPLVHRELVETSRTRGYVAAPICDGTTVVGLLHADCYFQDRVPGLDDLEGLTTFARFLGLALARCELAERLERLRRETERPVAPLSAFGGPDHAPYPAAPRLGPSAPSALGERLTARETDVLTLMADGASNQRIARRLVITEGTVKSHVKSILRKLGAGNRAEAVSFWLRSEYHQLTVGPGTRRPGTWSASHHADR